MATNDIKAFAAAGGANVLTQAEYLALAALSTGFTSGKASAKEVNKALRQATLVAAALAQFISDQGVVDVLDDGDVAGLAAKILSSINKTSQPLDATLSALAGVANSANKLAYFTDIDKMAATDFTQFARELLGKTDVAAAKTYLGLGTASGRNVGTTNNDIPDMSLFSCKKDYAGYQYFPTGMLLQWGTQTLNSSPAGTSTSTFPIAFPGACYRIIANHNDPASNVLAYPVISAPNRSSFFTNVLAINSDNFTQVQNRPITINWLAIGY
ncbi:TPA: phage tail protein [Enterobacter roggenkampii]|nr:phage tail protein [Enterobacter roggenkampii]HDR2531108.1 phage tail protein [Enterobacter roggenkampii]